MRGNSTYQSKYPIAIMQMIDINIPEGLGLL